MGGLTLVIARYNEYLEWLLPVLQDNNTILSNVFIYDKCTDPLPMQNFVSTLAGLYPKVHFKLTSHMNNVGREAHTYLHHIIHHYNDDDPVDHVTMFLQGNPIDHLHHYSSNSSNSTTARLGEFVQQCYVDACKNGVSKSFASSATFVHPQFKIHTHNGEVLDQDPLPLDQWFCKHISPCFPSEVWWWVGAMFAVQGGNIRRRPLTYYESLYATVSHNCCPETAHFLERSWYYIFDRSPIDISIVPFSLELSGQSNGVLYLEKCVENATHVTRKRMYIIVTQQSDHSLVLGTKSITDNKMVQIVFLNVQTPTPITSAHGLYYFVTNWIVSESNPLHILDSDVVYLTDAVQILCAKHLDNHVRKLVSSSKIGKGVALIPHRFEEMYRGHGVTRGMSANLNQRMYVLPTSDAKRTTAPGAVLPPGYNDAARKISYYSSKLPSEVETTSCITLYSTLKQTSIGPHPNPFTIVNVSLFDSGVSCIKTSEATSLFNINFAGFEFHYCQVPGNCTPLSDSGVPGHLIYIPPFLDQVTYFS
jgi:Protein of unknown function (DUF3431)